MRFKLIYDISPSEWSPHSRQELDSCLRQPPRTSRSEKYTAAVYASYVIGCSVNSRSQLHMSTKHGKWLTSRHVFRINFSFPHHCGIGDFGRCISISKQSPADFYLTWWNDSRRQESESNTFLRAIQQDIGIWINPEIGIRIWDQILALAESALW